MDDREVQPHRETKSLGAEDTFPYDLTTQEEMNVELDKIAQTVYKRLEHYKLSGRTITLKVKYNDFKRITRNHSFTLPVKDLKTISETAKQLLASTELENKKIRLLGITLSNFGEIASNPKKQSDAGQLELF